MKIAVVSTPPTPYRDPFWNEVARQPGVELEVFYLAGANRDRPWERTWQFGYRAEFLPGYNLAAWRGVDAECFWNPGIVRRLRDGRYDAMVFIGYNHLSHLVGMRYARRHGIPYFFTCESYLQMRRPAWRVWIKRPLVRWVTTRAAGAFPTGKLARDYLLHYGAKSENLAMIPNVPDVDAIAEKARALRPNRGELRRQFGVEGHPTVLYVGRLVSSKCVDVLIRAFGLVCRDSDARLVIVGDGPVRPSLEHLAADCGVAERVRFTGWVQPPELPQWYAAADLFVLPSYETWGVVVLEALASGVPVVMTDQAGSYADVINDPALGAVVPWRNPSGLARAILDCLRKSVSFDEMTRIWSPVREQMTYPVLARRMVALIADKVHEVA